MKKLVMIAFVLLSGYQVLHAETNTNVVKPLKGSRPNIIFVLTDDQGMGDLSCMGISIVSMNGQRALPIFK